MRELYRRAIDKCKPGFTVLVDVSMYMAGSDAVQNEHSEAVKLAERGGVSKVARVVGANPIGGMQLNRIAHTDAGYVSQNFKTHAEAEHFLDE